MNLKAKWTKVNEMQKIKRLSFKYIEEEDKYVVIKVQNVLGIKPKQRFSEKNLRELPNDIEVVVKWQNVMLYVHTMVLV